MSFLPPLSQILPAWTATCRQNSVSHQRTVLKELEAELSFLRFAPDSSPAEELAELTEKCEHLEAELAATEAELTESKRLLEAQARAIVESLLEQYVTLEGKLLKAEKSTTDNQSLAELESLEDSLRFLSDGTWTGWKSSNPAMVSKEFEAMASDGWLAEVLQKLAREWDDVENHRMDAEKRGETLARLESRQQELQQVLAKLEALLEMQHPYAPVAEVWAGYDALLPEDALTLMETSMLPLATDAVLEASQWRWPFRPNIQCLHTHSS